MREGEVVEEGKEGREERKGRENGGLPGAASPISRGRIDGRGRETEISNGRLERFWRRPL